MAKLISGSKTAKGINEYTKIHVARLKKTPLLAVILVKTDNARVNKANQLYCDMKARKAEKVGIASKTYVLPKDITQAQLETKVQTLNQDDKVTGILVQLPLPKQIDENTIEALISPSKDVDGVNPVNIGKLAANVDQHKAFYPTGCTPTGIIHLLNTYFGATKKAVSHDILTLHWSIKKALLQQFWGKRAVILGRSNIVGRPLALMLINRGCEVTVLNHKFGLDKSLRDYTKHADIIISATGHYHTLTSKDLGDTHPIIIDAGENTDPHTHKLCGDVSQPAHSYSSAYSTVPGGVGPMTIAMLLRQTCELAEHKYLQY